MPMNRVVLLVLSLLRERLSSRLRSETKEGHRFMGSGRFLFELHDAFEPWCLALPAVGETKFKTKKGHRIMGGFHGHSAVHKALEPAGTFNVQRSTLNGKQSTINLPSINRFMGSGQFHWNCIMPMNLTFWLRTGRPRSGGGSWEAPLALRPCIVPLNRGGPRGVQNSKFEARVGEPKGVYTVHGKHLYRPAACVCGE
jgi:hypothetical protein